RAADGAVGADGALHFGRDGGVLGSLGLADGAIGELARECPGPCCETRALQKRPPIHRRERNPRETAKTWTGRGNSIAFPREQHVLPPPRALLCGSSRGRARSRDSRHS